VGDQRVIYQVTKKEKILFCFLRVVTKLVAISHWFVLELYEVWLPNFARLMM
jgi:hypothetical protein